MYFNLFPNWTFKVNYYLKDSKFLVIPSKSEVFPLVYYEALKAIDAIVNNIDFFKLVSKSNNDHIFCIEDPLTIKKVITWANNLNEKNYQLYLNSLKKEFLIYYKKFSSNLNSII